MIIDKNNIPKHIAIIMDGNGRWAKERNLPRTQGHRAGIKRIREIVKAANEFGIKVVTFFTFSTENWSRPKKEVGMLMGYLDNFLTSEIKDLDKNNIRVIVIGRDRPIPEYLLNKIQKAEARTENNTGMVVVLALNYGSRQEIIDAVKKFTESAMEGKTNLEDLDVESFNNYFYTAGLPDPDLLIRTSGEMRLSNFLLWQISYAELYFSKKYWPDFDRQELEKAIMEYQKRERRFGRIDVKQKDN